MDRELPTLVQWAAEPQALLRLMSLALALPSDGLIVECGSGTSTVWLAQACKQGSAGRVVALEHDEHYAGLTRGALIRAGLEDFADVRSAPLESFVLDGHPYSWYATEAWADLTGIDVLFVDGPPGALGPRSRYPAFPLLGKSLRIGAAVVLDDMNRDDERRVAEQWAAAPVGGITLRDEGSAGRARVFVAAPAG